MNTVAQRDAPLTCECGRETEPVPIGEALHRYCAACDRLWNERGFELHAAVVCEELV